MANLALAIAMTAFGKEGTDIALVISLGYVIQIQMGHGWLSLLSKFTVKQMPNCGAVYP